MILHHTSHGMKSIYKVENKTLTKIINDLPVVIHHLKWSGCREHHRVRRLAPAPVCPWVQPALSQDTSGFTVSWLSVESQSCNATDPLHLPTHTYCKFGTIAAEMHLVICHYLLPLLICSSLITCVLCTGNWRILSVTFYYLWLNSKL